MLKIISIAATGLLLAAAIPAQASATGLLLNDDSVELHHSREPALFGREVHQSYTLLYSQEPDPRNLLLRAEFELQDHLWEFMDNQSLAPRVDLLFVDFMDERFAAAAIGASHRLAPSESHSFEIQTEITLAPPLTTMDKGKYLWSFKSQLNYPLTDNVELNVGYRSITMKLLNNYEDGFERGLYFGVTTLFE